MGRVMAEKWQLASISHIGGRDENQDAQATFQDSQSRQILIVVADGMGGHSGGSEAARVICDTAQELWAQRLQRTPEQLLQTLVSESHSRVNAMSAVAELDARSTLVALWLDDSRALSVHVGDSRVMQYGPAGLIKRTVDHSVAQLRVLSGKITEAQMATDSGQSSLITSIGGEQLPEPEFTEWDLAAGAGFIVCTDGFWEILDSQAQHALMMNDGDLQTALQGCLTAALEQASDRHDNCTAVLLRPSEGVVHRAVTAIAESGRAADSGSRRLTIPLLLLALILGVLVVLLYAPTLSAQEQFPLAHRSDDGGFASDRPWSDKPLTDPKELDAWLTGTLAPGLGLEGENTLRVESPSSAPGGVTVIRLQQQYQGRPVIGLDSVVILNPQGYPALVHGKHLALEALTVDPLITAEQAYASAALTPDPDVPAALVYWARGTEIKLAWQLTGYATQAGFQLFEVFVDALNGNSLEHIPLNNSVMRRTVWDMSSACQRQGIGHLISGPEIQRVRRFALDNGLGRSEGRPSGGSARVDRMFDELGASYTFLSRVFDMNSIDNDGLTLEGAVGVRYDDARPGIQCVGDGFNASWYPSLNFLAVPDNVMPLLEVFGHEFAHGIVSNGSGLKGSGASGALNEALADMVGVAYRAWRESGGSLDTPEVSSWQYSSAFWQLRKPDGVMRDMQQPKRVHPGIPDHFADYRSNMGVHAGANVMGHGFYLMAEGGQHRRLGRGVRVEHPLGIQDTARIAAYAAAYTLTPSSDYPMARIAMAYAATVLFGEGSPQWQSVHQAFDAIGVPGRWLPVPQRPPIAVPPAAPPVPEPAPGIPAPTPVPAPAPTSVPPPPQADIPGEPAVSRSEPLSVLQLPLAVWYAVLGALLLGGLLLLYLGRPKPKLFNPGYSGPQRPSAIAPEPTPAPNLVRSPVASSEQWLLEALDGSENITLHESQLTSPEGQVIGRAHALCHVIMESRQVSRRHLRLRRLDGQLHCEDLNSSNGSAIDGRAIKPFVIMPLRQGQILTIAGFAYQLKQEKCPC